MEPKTEVRLIALDLDGTLLNSKKELSPGNREALLLAAEAGIEIVPATGRFYKGMPECIRELPFIRYCITINGAQVLDLVTEETIHADEIETERALELYESLKGLPVIYDCYAGGWGYMTEHMQQAAGDYIRDPHLLSMVRTLRSPVPELTEWLRAGSRRPQKMQVFTCDAALHQKLLQEIPMRFPDFSVTSAYPENIEINSRLADKGRALLALAVRLCLSPEETMAFGDARNDLTLLRAAGTSVAMANASPELKTEADRITLSNDEDGVAAVIRQLL